jgi:hypothetical protein
VPLGGLVQRLHLRPACMDVENRVTGLDQRFRNQRTAEGLLVDGAAACLQLSLQVTPGIAVARESGVVFGVHLDKDGQ